MTRAPRYAVYWVPAREHPLWAAGCAWLGRDAEDGGRSFDMRPSTVEPRRYGFHATLKAPMRLGPTLDESHVVEALRSIATTTPRFAMPALQVGTLATFVALRPVADPGAEHPLRVFADRCVVELDPLRAAWTDDEWTARASGLDADQRAMTRRYGYPHVLERWRFHMTLSDAFATDARGLDRRRHFMAGALDHFAEALTCPLVATEVAIFVEAEPGAPFRLAHRLALAA